MLTLSFFYVRFSIFMYSMRLVLVLSVFCASFNIYMRSPRGVTLESVTLERVSVAEAVGR